MQAGQKILGVRKDGGDCHATFLGLGEGEGGGGEWIRESKSVGYGLETWENLGVGKRR